jgi:ornithine carrier protein
MQVQRLVSTPRSSLSLPGPITVLTSVLRTQGIRGLWLGHTGTLIRETGGTAAWFCTKEFVASLLLSRRLATDPPSTKDHLIRPWESALSGACAGVAFNLSLYPADTVKSAMQTEPVLRPRDPHASAVLEKPSFLRTFVAMYRAQGIPGLYAGCGITVARSIPSSAIIFLIYDGLKQYFT